MRSGTASYKHWFHPESLGQLPNPQLQRAFFGGVVALALFRLAVVAWLPLDLSGDEAYYWDWGRHLDWGYFSKPPGIGWLMALAGWIGGNTEFGVRMFAVGLGTGALILLYRLGERLYGSAVGLLAALVFVANPGNAALNLILTIDAPLMLFWIGAIYAFWRFRETGFTSWAWAGWLWLALAGGLLSKQIMVVFHLMVLLFLTLNAMDRPLLSRPKLWLVLAGSLVAWVPPLIWNWRHGWLTYRHTLHHFDAGSTAFVERLVRLVEFLGFQGGLVTPLVFICLIAALALALRRWRTIGPRERLLVFLSAPGLLAMMLLTWRQRVNPNWPAVFYPAATVLLVAWAAGVWGTGTGLERLRRWFAPALKLGLILAILTYVAVLGLSTGWLRLPTLDPSARLRGWSELARDVGDELARTPRPKETLVITQSHRFATSELAFYVPGHPKVFRFNSKPDVIESQYDLWYPRADGTVDALVIVQGTASALDPRLHARFSTIRFLKELRYPRQAGGRKIYSLFIGERLQHWPRPLPPG